MLGRAARRWSFPALGALGGVLALMGCNSTSSKEKEYRHEVNAICAAAQKRLDKVPRPSSLAEVAKTAKQEIAIREEVIAQLGELPPPTVIAGGANNVFSDQEARHERALAIEKAAEEKDEKKLREVRHHGETEFELEAERARVIGLRECAEL